MKITRSLHESISYIEIRDSLDYDDEVLITCHNKNTVSGSADLAITYLNLEGLRTLRDHINILLSKNHAEDRPSYKIES